MKFNHAKTVFAVALAAVAAGSFIPAAHAQVKAASPVTLTSDVKIERTETDAAGNATVKLFTPKDIAVVPGDNVVFTLLVNNTGAEAAAGFRATNPMPSAVRFVSVAEAWADVSVDGGVNWGKLTELKVKTKDATGTSEVERAAAPEDVTHVRWVFPDAIAAGSKRTVSYRGVVK